MEDAEQGVSEPILVWDTTTVPNGTYIVRIVASDSPSNPTETALAGEMDSVTLDIDNTPPIITVQPPQVANGKTTVSFEVKDDHSPILRVECSEDGTQWRAAFPVDGMADSRVERYQVTFDGTLGPRGLSIRASDAMNNVSTTQVDAPRGR